MSRKSRIDPVEKVKAAGSYIRYYNTEWIQRKLHLMTPVEYHENCYAAA